MKSLVSKIMLAIALLCGVNFLTAVDKVQAAETPTYKIAWSHYTGWEPWDYAASSGILKKWADKFGVKIQLTPPMDYMESINLFTSSKDVVGVVVTNMDILTTPCVGGIDCSVIILGDFSNGNDGIPAKNATSMKDLKGRKVYLVELSVSHYLLARSLQSEKMSERDVTVVNTSDSEIVSVFQTSGDKAACVTWNPQLMQVRNVPKTTMLFDSSMIPGEILDLMVVKTDTPDAVKKALTGAWYEVMNIMAGAGPETDKALEHMSKTAGGTLAEYKAQLKTTRMYYSAKEAAEFTEGSKVKETMEYVRTFLFDKGLFKGGSSKDFIGIKFPDGSVLGDPKNVKLRFDSSFMQQAAKGELK